MDELTPPASFPSPSPVDTAGSTSGLTKKILIGSITLAILIVGFVAWWMFSSSGKGLTVSIVAPESLQAGIPAEISVNMSNDSGSDLKDAQVSLSLPDGLIFVGTPGKRSVENHKVGILPADQLTKETFMVMPTTIQNALVSVKASVSYIPGALSSRFQKDITESIVVGEPGIQLNIAPPTKVFGGEEFEIEITYRNTSKTDFSSAEINLSYPIGFTFGSATKTASDAAHTTYAIDALPAGGEGSFSIKGFVVGQDNENFIIKGVMRAVIGEGTYDIGSQAATVIVQPSPLSIQVEVLPSNTATFGLGDSLRYRLNYKNNTQIGLRDVIVRDKLTGEMFDLRTLKSTGVLRATDNTIIWNAARVPQFATLAPGASGSVEFSVQLRTAYPITRLSSKNYSVSVKAEIESPTVPANVAAGKTLGIAELSNKVRGLLNVSSIGYYRDAVSGIVNNGVFPPRVGQPTQFTIHWVLRNMSTDVDTVHTRAFLGPNVRYTGIYKSSVASTTFAYNDRTQEVMWDVAQIQATRGILTDPLTLTFQVELTPAIDQVQTSPVIIQETGVTYRDLFTGESLANTAKPITTRLPDDATLGGSDRSVKE
jgi:hypothetical protein